MTKVPSASPGSTHRGSAGGSAAAGGVQYASAVAAWSAVKLLAATGASLPWDLTPGTAICAIHCESPTEVDDLVLTLTPGGTVYIQIKHGLGFSAEFKKALDQLIRQFRSPGFSSAQDRLVILTDDSATGSIRNHLVTVLERARKLPADHALVEVGKSNDTRDAFDRLQSAFDELWVEASGGAPATDAEFRAFLSCAYLTVCDPTSGRDGNYAVELLKRMCNESEATAIWKTLNQHFLNASVLRKPVDRPSLWETLAEHGYLLSTRKIRLPGREVRLGDLLKTMTQAVISKEASFDRYSFERYVPRRVVDQSFNAFIESEQKLMLVIGQSGTGKSSWCMAQADDISKAPVLLIQGESLTPSDTDIQSTAWRLVSQHVEAQGGQLSAKHEFLEWIAHTSLIVVVDGLDRASEPFRAKLQSWLENTIAFLLTASMKLVVTSRPETLSGMLNVLGMQQKIVYRHKEKEPYVVISDYDREEAAVAASLLGKPWLTKFRHPSLMAFAAAISERDAQTLLAPSRIIERYLDIVISKIQAQSGVLRESLDDFIDKLGMALVESEEGVLPRSAIGGLAERDRASFDALKRGNLLRFTDDSVRVEPDEISEFLQGRSLNIDRTIANLKSNLSRPLKLGALRAAIARLAWDSPLEAAATLTEIIKLFEHSPTMSTRAFAASVLLEMEDWSTLFSLAERLLSNWDVTNLLFRAKGYDSCLAIASDSRWSPMQRVQLLWLLVGGEDSYTWRSKHWLTPESAPNFTRTPWRYAMLDALGAAASDGLTFLLERFDSTEPLPNGTEANVADLAKGLFFLASGTQVATALDLLVQTSQQDASAIRYHVANQHPREALSWLRDRGIDSVSNKLLWTLLEAIPKPSTIDSRDADFVREILQTSQDLEIRRQCLQILTGSGDEQSAIQLIEFPSLDMTDTALFNIYDGERYSRLVRQLIDRVIRKEVDPEALNGIASSIPEAKRNSHVTLVAAVLTGWLRSSGADVARVAETAEYLLYEAFKMEVVPAPVFELVELILEANEPPANQYLIYAAVGGNFPESSSSAGKAFQKSLTKKLAEDLKAPENRSLMANLLIGKHWSVEYAVEMLCAMIDTQSGDALLDRIDDFLFVLPHTTEIVQRTKDARPRV